MATNNVLNTSIIAKAAVKILENELVMASHVYRGYEEEFDKKVNGYMVGDTISVRKPNQFFVRSGAVITTGGQNIDEGKLTITVNQQKGVDFQLSSTDLTLRIEDLSERVIKPAMVRLANQIDVDLMNLYFNIPNYVGQLAAVDQPIDHFSKFARGAERLDQMSCPQDDRYAVLSPESYWALASSQTVLLQNQIVGQAYRKGDVGPIGGVQTYMSQNVPTYVGTPANGDAATVTGAQSTTWASVRNTEATPGSMSLITGGWGTTDLIRAGTVFTIGSAGTGVFAVNPVTKAVLPFLQHFTVLADVTASGGAATLTITPPIIPVGATEANATTSIAAGAGSAINTVGGASLSYRQNMMWHKNAFALVMVPMVKPAGAVDMSRESYKGISVRLIPFYDGVNDLSTYRLDVLYGLKTIDNRMAVRMGGAALPGTLGIAGIAP